MSDLEETIARKVYRAMQWAYRSADGGEAPKWVDGGNSDAQAEARQAARDILEAISQKDTDQ